MLAQRLMSAAGILVILGACWALSENRGRASWRIVLWGLGLQFGIGLLLIRPASHDYYKYTRVFFDQIYRFADMGAVFLFGKLAANPDFLILKLASVVIFVASLMSVLYYLRIIQVFVYVFARIMRWTLRISGAESLGAAMFVLMGIEAVTGLKNYIKGMTRSELFTIMVGFMATIAGSVMAAYVSIFGASAGHILTASLMSAPAAVMLSKLMIPETEEPATGGMVSFKDMAPAEDNIVAAAANGAIDGVKLAAFIGAMLLAFVALINVADSLLEETSKFFFLKLHVHASGITLTRVFGVACSPIAFLMGIPWKDCAEVGRLLAVKVIFNEWLSYEQLGKLKASGAISARAVTLSTYALCSFANFGSLGILIGGIGGLAPERRGEVSRMGLKALFAGALAGFLTAAVAGVITAQ